MFECEFLITKTFQSKMKMFSRKLLISFLILTQNSARGGSNGYSESIFGAKLRKIGIPLHIPVLLLKVGYKGVNSVHYKDMLS